MIHCTAKLNFQALQTLRTRPWDASLKARSRPKSLSFQIGRVTQRLNLVFAAAKLCNGFYSPPAAFPEIDRANVGRDLVLRVCCHFILNYIELPYVASIIVNEENPTSSTIHGARLQWLSWRLFFGLYSECVTALKMRGYLCPNLLRSWKPSVLSSCARSGTLGDLRSGSICAVARRCGKPGCHCAKPNGPGHHPQTRLTSKLEGKTVAESFSSPAAFEKRRATFMNTSACRSYAPI
jgi:hypothetical protein